MKPTFQKGLRHDSDSGLFPMKNPRRSAPLLGRSNVDLASVLIEYKDDGLPSWLRPGSGALRPGLAPPPKRISKPALMS